MPGIWIHRDKNSILYSRNTVSRFVSAPNTENTAKSYCICSVSSHTANSSAQMPPHSTPITDFAKCTVAALTLSGSSPKNGLTI